MKALLRGSQEEVVVVLVLSTILLEVSVLLVHVKEQGEELEGVQKMQDDLELHFQV